MAKKSKIDIDDNFDLDSDLDFGDMNFGEIDVKDDRSPIVKVATSIPTGVLNGMRDTGFLKTTVKEVLPNGFGQTIDLADKTAGSVKTIIDDSVKSIKPAIKEIKRVLPKLVPTDSKLVPQTVKDLMAKWKDDSRSQTQNQSEEEQRDAMMSTQMSEIFTAQVSQDQANRSEDSARDRLKEGLDLTRHKDMFGIANSTAMSLSKIEQYHYNLDLQYKKKSLELQFRNLFAIQDATKINKELSEQSSKLLADIVKNTGLPEFVKITDSENFKQVAKNKFAESMSNGLFGDRNKLLQDITANFSKKIKSTMTDLRDSVLTGLQGAEDGKEMGESLDSMPGAGGKLGMAGNVIGSAGGQFGISKLVNKSKNKIIDGIDNIGRRFGFDTDTKKTSAKLEARVAGIHGEVGDFKNKDYSQDQSMLARGLEILQDMIPGKLDNKLDTTKGGDMFAAFAPNGQTQKSLIEIIPGYLARLLREVQVFRTGDESIKLTKYNFDSNSFTSSDKLIKSIVTQTVSKQTVNNLNANLDDAIETILGDNKVSDKATDAIRKQFVKNSANGRSVSAKNIGSEENYKELDNETLQEVLAVMKDYFNDFDSNANKRKSIYKKDKFISDSLTANRKHLQENVNLGNIEEVRASGLVDKEDNISDERFLEYVLDRRNGELTKQEQAVQDAKDKKIADEKAKRERLARSILPKGLIGKENELKEGDYGYKEESAATKKKRETTEKKKQDGGLKPDEATSDYFSKENIKSFSGKTALSKIKQLPITQWAYKQKDKLSNLGKESTGTEQPTGEHVGPMAQTVQKVMGNEAAPDGKKINLTTLNGFNMKAIQELDKRQAQVLDHLDKLSPTIVKIGETIQNKAKQLKTEIKDSNLQDTKQKLTEQLNKTTGVVKKAVTDLYVEGEANPRIQAALLAAGKYRDKVTNKIITAYDQITNDVIDENNNVVITKADFYKLKYYDTKTKLFTKFESAKTKLLAGKIDLLGSLNQTKANFIDKVKSAVIDKISMFVSGVKDVYVKGDPNPRLLAVKLKAGNYKDKLSGATITDPSLINGDVVDELGNTIIQAEEIPKLIVYEPAFKTFGPLKMAFGVAKWLGAGLWHYQSKIAPKWTAWNFKQLGKIASLGSALAKRLVFGKVKDVYVEGKSEPVLYATRIRNGEYKNRDTGKTLRTHNDITGVVIDKDNEIVISAEDLPKLRVYDSLLKWLNPFKYVGLALRGIGSVIKGTVKWGAKASMWSLGKLKDITVGTVKGIAGFLTKPKDVYIAGKTTAILEGKSFKENKYYSLKTGNVLTHHNQIDGAVVDKDGQIILSEKDAATGLYGVDGKRLKGGIGRLLGKAINLITSPFRFKRKLLIGKGIPKSEKDAKSKGISSADYISSKSLSNLEDIKSIISKAFKVNSKGKIKDKLASNKSIAGVTGAGGILPTLNPKAEDKPTDGVIDTAKDLATGAAGGLAGKLLGGIKKLGSKILKIGGPAALTAGAGYLVDGAAGKLGAGGNAIDSNADDANWDQMSAFEKMQSGLARGIEKGSRFMFLDNMANSAQAKRIKNESEYFKNKNTTPIAQKPVNNNPYANTLAPASQAILPDIELPVKAESQTATSMQSGVSIPSSVSMASGQLLDGRNADSYLSVPKGINVNDLNPSFLKSIRGMAEEYGMLTGKKLPITSGARTFDQQAALFKKFGPGRAAPPGNSLHEYGLAFDADPATLDELDKLGLMKKYGLTRPVGQEPWHVEPAGAQPDLNGVKQDPNYAAQAVESGVGRGGEGFGTIGKEARKYGRDKNMAVSLLNASSSVVDNSSNLTPSLPKPIIPTDSKVAVAGITKAAGITTVSNSSISNTSATSGLDNETNIKASLPSASKGGFITGSSMLANSNSNLLADPTVKVPDPKGSGYEGVKDTITAAAKMVGADPSVAIKTVAVESGFNPNARASSSSASGLFQFLKGTWDELITKYGSKYGFTVGNTSAFDAKANSIIGAHYIKDNAKALSGAGVNAGATEIYLSHFLGPAGARRFLSVMNKDPNQSATSVMPDAAKSNPGIFLDRGRERSLSEVYALLDTRVKDKVKSFGISVEDSSSNIPAIASIASKGKVSNITNPGSSPIDTVSTVNRSAPVATKTPLEASVRASSTSIMTDSSQSPIANAYGASPITRAPVSTPTNPNQISKEIMEPTNNILDKQLEVQKKMLDALEKIFGVVNKVGTIIPSNPTSNPNVTNSIPDTKGEGLKPYTSPKPAIPMNRNMY